MALPAGTRLGPYEVLSPLGAGGMGEVYRARDSRLARDVAIKVLPSSLSADPDRLRRFEQEAKAAGMLNHPNITAVYDVGEQDGFPYVVQELLEGETLRQVLSGGALSSRKAVDWASQIARGLAAAHEKGIVHRDLKPENLFVTKAGRVKILDFGLAKLKQPEAVRSPLTEAPTITGTEPGVVLGTVGYLSPEQVRGLPADPRSDIFAFGAVLYEMLAGERAFRGESGVEVLNAILKEEPPDLSASGREMPPALELVVRHCLEKRPDERFQSAQDLAFNLDALSGISGSRSAAAIASGPRTKRRWLPALAGAALFLAGAAGAWFLASRKPAGSSSLSFHQLTFRNGTIFSAKFAPDGQTIVYSAAWGGAPYDVFSTRRGSPESRSLGLPSAFLLGISDASDLALGLRRPNHGWTLAQAPLGGGSPREILEDISDAAWERDGKRLVVVRSVAGRSRLEGPIGKVLYETDGEISAPRVSPAGDSIAFLEYAQAGNGAGTVAMVDRTGKRRTLTQEWGNVLGLVWGPAGDELWFGAQATGESTDLLAVTLSGQQRLLIRSAGSLWIQDVFRDGRALVITNHSSGRMMYVAPGEKGERDLSWLDVSDVTDISPDGKRLLFMEGGGPAGKDFLIYMRATDGSPAVRIGEGLACGFSPDGKWVLAIPHASPSQIVLLPTGPGASKQVTRDRINHAFAHWMPGGDQIVFVGSEPGRQPRLFVQDLSGGRPRAISAEGLVRPSGKAGLAVSPDGRLVAASGVDRLIGLYPVDGGQPAGLPGGAPGDLPIRWSVDGRFLYVFESAQLPGRIFRVEIPAGRRELWKEIIPSDPSGVHMIWDVQVTPDGQSYAYSYSRNLGELYLVEGLK